MSISPPRSAAPGRAGADARRSHDAPVSADSGTGRRGGRAAGEVDVEVGGVPHVRGAHPGSARRADGAQLGDLRLAVMMIDGLELKGRTMIVALKITTEGVRIPLGLWEGSTENETVATELLSDLVERGLDLEQGMLFVIDGSKAFRKAPRSVFGRRRCSAVSGTMPTSRLCRLGCGGPAEWGAGFDVGIIRALRGT